MPSIIAFPSANLGGPRVELCLAFFVKTTKNVNFKKIDKNVTIYTVFRKNLRNEAPFLKCASYFCLII